MVYGILIFHLETSTLYFNNYYFQEGNDIDKNIRTQFVIREIMNDYIFKKQTTKDLNSMVNFETNQILFDSIFLNKFQKEIRFLNIIKSNK